MSDIQAILDWYDAAPGVARLHKAAADLGKLADQSNSPIRVAVLRNITIEMIGPHLTLELARIGKLVKLRFGEFDAVTQEVLGDDTWLKEFQPDVVIFAQRLHTLASPLAYRFNSLDSSEVKQFADEVLRQTKRLLSKLREFSAATILVNNFEEPLFPAKGFLDATMPTGQLQTIRDLNAGLSAIVSEVSSAYVVDIPSLVTQIGTSAAFDERYWHSSRAPYKNVLLAKLASVYARPLAVQFGKNKKCLVLDCDNTLWGGVIGEDGIDGIKIGHAYPGSAYRDFQLAILDLYKRGILLALCSKNNEADAMEVFVNHPDMVLRPDHIVARRINWQDKAANLREIARELNIGLDSLVFLDDNPVECERVKSEVPEVQTVCMSGDPAGFREVLQSLTSFDVLSLTAEDLRRSEMYRAQAEREQLLSQSDNVEDYLASLRMTISINRGDVQAIGRIAQLTQKTNQFNLSTKRYTEDAIAQFIKGPGSFVYSARVKDKFDDNGIVAIAIVEDQGEAAVVDTFLMSCRVIGRGVETALLARVAQDAADRGLSKLVSYFVPTPKNEPAKRFLPEHGFSPTGVEFEFELAIPGRLSEPSWFEQISYEVVG